MRFCPGYVTLRIPPESISSTPSGVQAFVRALVERRRGDTPLFLLSQGSRQPFGSIRLDAVGEFARFGSIALHAGCPVCDDINCQQAGLCTDTGCGKRRCEHQPIEPPAPEPEEKPKARSAKAEEPKAWQVLEEALVVLTPGQGALPYHAGHWIYDPILARDLERGGVKLQAWCVPLDAPVAGKK